MESKFIEVLNQKLEKSDTSLTQGQISQVATFQEELISWNKKMNLTRITEDEDFAVKHVIDSLMVEKLVKIKEEAKVIDIGTGPGVPGIILKIKRPDISIGLLESQLKKSNFLTHVTSKLDFSNTNIINERAEQIAKLPEKREVYDIAIARAVARFDMLLELCLPFVRIGGIFVAMKSENVEEEIAISQKALDTLGGKLEDNISYQIDEGISRRLLVVRKEKTTPRKYPRRPNAIKNKPL